MPYVRRTTTVRRFRKSYRPRKYGKKTGRKRFSKKRFYKQNNLNTLSIRPMVYPRELYVKMKWIKLEQLATPLNSSIRRVYLGNSASPYPPQGALTLFAAPASSIPAGEVYPGGLVEYGSFYDKYTILGTSLKMIGHCVNTNSNIVIRAVCIPIMPSPDSATDTIEGMINQLDAYTFDQLMSYPQAQWRQVVTASSGSNKFVFKFFRKTKDMFMIKDMKDEQDKYNVDMPTTAGASGERPSTTGLWGYYVRMFNETGTTTNVETVVQLKQYYRLNQRRYTQATTST